jgi:shikimate dehydrogenase
VALTGVLGFPVGHSRSPAMMTAAFRELGLDWRYVPLPVPPELFAATARALPGSGFAGANVTIPHKLAAHDLAGERTPAARAIGAANALTFRDGGVQADNTDAGGFLAALGESPEGRSALVLGAGGAARAVVWALREAGAAEVSIWNRTPQRARELAATFGARQLQRPERAEILVNATSVGLEDGASEAGVLAALFLEDIDPPAVLVDLVYGREPTALIRWGARYGARVVDGLEVLVRQGALSLQGWTGQEPPLEAMRDAARGSF